MSGVIKRLGHHARMILILAYYEGMTVADLAPYVGVTPDEAVKLHQLAILEIHAEMLKVVA
jgi:DNA-directed RNA polymerase specialized sigma subunit